MPDPITGLSAEYIALQQAVVGRYSLERELGRGGMGVVFLARDVALDRPVAIKLLPPAMAAQASLKERFLREARTAAKLSHPNIVPIFSVEQIGGGGGVGELVFFVMAYVDGETLGQRLKAKGPLTAREAVKLLQEVAWALAYAHLRGIVHRDVKPDNILLEAATGRALVSDFGIARATETSGATAVGEVLGTAQYMSPEQACGEAVDGRSDLYSLGIVGFLAVSGRLPFDAPDIAALLAQQITRPAPPLAAVQPGAPRRLAAAIDRCLAKDPAQRFQSGEQLAEALAEETAVVKQVPAPIRVWLQRGAGSRGPLAVWSALMGVAIVSKLFAGQLPDGGAVLFLVGPLAAYGMYRVHFTRRVLESGYSIADIRLALRDQVAQRREEVAFETAAEPPLIGRVIRWLTYGGLGLALVSAAVIWAETPMDWTTSLKWLVAFGSGALVTVGGAVTGLVMPGRRVKPGDPARSLQSRIWNGRLGEWFARVSMIGLRPRAMIAASANRPTEVAIGMVSVALFEALPKETRKSLRDLPQVIEQLEADAAATRARVDELNAMLAGPIEGPVHSASLAQGGAAAERIAEHQAQLKADLTAQRDAAAKRMAAAVAALENVRLDLLRLKAGVGTVDELSADLSKARDIQGDIERAIEGQEEVRSLLTSSSTSPS